MGLTRWSAVSMIWRRELIRFSRDRAQIAGSCARPILWLVVLGFGMGSVLRGFEDGSYVEYLFPGVVAMNLLFASFLSAISIIWDREFGFLKEMLVAPISRATIALGKAGAGATVALLQGGIVLCFIPILGLPVSPSRLLLGVPVMFGIAFPMTALGILIASRMTSFEGFGTIANFVVMPMFFLSGAIFPLEGVPGWMLGLSRINPLTYGVDLLRAAFYGAPVYPPALSGAVLGVFAVMALSGAVAAFCRR